MADGGQTGPLLKARTIAALRLLEARAYLADRKGRSASAGKKNVLIFGQGRSGTTLFEQLMVSTGHFTGRHEVLNTVTREVVYPLQFVRGLGRQVPDQNVIVHVKPEHLGRARRKRGPVDASAFLNVLVDEGWNIVHVQRRDVLRQMISKYVAKARGSFHKTDESSEDIRLDIPESEFLADYERRRSWLEDEVRLLDGLPHQVVVYEEHLECPENHQRTINTVLDQLSLEHRPVSTRLKKISALSPAKYLVNRDSLQNAFVAKGWEWTL